jgi:LPXTG-motif cell wall-anchored protein
MRKILVAAAVVSAIALTAQGQVAQSKQSGSPTLTQAPMRIAEPADGATIQGPDFNIVLALPAPQTEGTAVNPAERKSSGTPIYQVWLDGKNLGNIPATRNVMNVHADTYGAHKIDVMAKNAAGQMIGRQTITVTTVEIPSAAPVAAAPAPAPPKASAPPPAPPRAEPKPAEPAPAPAAEAPAPAPAPKKAKKLPKTGTDLPLVALLGWVSLTAGLGLSIGRRRKTQ